jgi:23S rRNA pseudouridine2604 synthase
MENKIRLSKVMSERGICSRREADDLIARGLVKVNGEIVSELGTRIDPESQIELLQQGHDKLDAKVTIMINKPIGYVSSQPEDGYKAAVELVLEHNQMAGDKKRLQPSHLRGLAPAGRLDIDSQGLLLLTQDGVIAKKIIGENSDVEKEYLVRVEGQLSPENMEKLRNGSMVLDGRQLLPAQVDWLNEDQLKIILREGMKRQIRRMCEAVGLRVVGLKRVRVGRLMLGSLPEGQWRFLKPGEII